jgi:hypothetical protein
MKFLEELLRRNPRNPSALSTTTSNLVIELMAIPEEYGGGFHACIPSLGRHFALSDSEDGIVDALDQLNTVVNEYVADKEHVGAYKEMGINIPPKMEE